MSKNDVTLGEITVNGTVYAPKGQGSAPAVDTNGQAYVLVRSAQAGVFAGYLSDRDGDEVTLNRSRRIWYWAGAASLSQLSRDGVSKPGECKFSVPVDAHEVLGVCEILPITEKARESIAGVKEWTQ